MSLFEAAALLGVFPAGVLLGMGWGAVSLLIQAERRLPRPCWVLFTGDMLLVLIFSFSLFSLGVGMEGHLRYPVVCGAAVGFGGVRLPAYIIIRAIKRHGQNTRVPE